MSATATTTETPTKPAEDCGCGDPSTKVATNDSLPSSSTLKSLWELPVIDSDGKSHPFSSVIQHPELDRHLVLFIRHFLCGVCQEYIRHLAHILPPENLPPRTQISIVGHGDAEMIGPYKSTTGCPYPIYTDPTRKTFAQLGMGSTLAMAKGPKYFTQSLTVMTLGNIMQGLSSGRKMLAAGDVKQIGGELLFEQKSGEWVCGWAHRMKATNDHTEVEELARILEATAREGGIKRQNGWGTIISSWKAWNSGWSKGKKGIGKIDEKPDTMQQKAS